MRSSGSGRSRTRGQLRDLAAIALVVAAVATAATPTPARADPITIEVDCTSNPSALMDALVTFSADELVLLEGPCLGIPTVPSGARITIQGIAPGTSISEPGDGPAFGTLRTSASMLTLRDLTIIGGPTERQGGAISGSGNMTLENVVVTGGAVTDEPGQADGLARGGGIYWSAGNVIIVNSTITGNTVTSSSGEDTNVARGAGIYAGLGAGAVMYNSTIAGNTAAASGPGSASSGGGVAGDGAFTSTGSIVQGNVADLAPDCFTSTLFLSGGYNMIGSVEGCVTTLEPTDQVGVDPEIGPLADNGGMVPTMLPAADGPAIDAFQATWCALQPHGVDARGFLRPSGVGCDVGAAEIQHRPDGLIRGTGSDYLGEDLYDMNGFDQTATQLGHPGSRLMYAIRIENDGEIRSTFEVKGCARSGVFTVTYRTVGPAFNPTLSRDVTRDVVRGDYRVEGLPPGASSLLAVQIDLRPSAWFGADKRCRIRITDPDSSRQRDAVFARVHVTWPGVGTDVSERGPVQDESVDAMADLYDELVDGGRRRLQILDKLCAEPRRRELCSLVPLDLRRAIKHRFDTPVSWVSHMRSRSGTFWVLAPVGWGVGTAHVRVASWETSRYGCRGHRYQNYAWVGSAWISTSGGASTSCPAQP